jgi:cytochrome b subunit of formate dehydrogenase
MGAIRKIIQWATDPWGQTVPIHIAWFLIWVAAIAGLSFLVIHAIWIRYFARREGFADRVQRELEEHLAAELPERIPRHSLVARLFHWIMAASMFTLLFTAFLPKVGVQFDWVTYHWIAGTVLTASVLFHVIHASFFGQSALPPRRFAKYPLENKLYHGAIIATGLSAILTGVFMLFRVRTGILPRNPYLLSDMTWGLMYVLHGLAGVGLIALVMMHVYFAARPEKLAITKSMIFGSMDREFYLEHYDPERWPAEGASVSPHSHSND